MAQSRCLIWLRSGDCTGQCLWFTSFPYSLNQSVGSICICYFPALVYLGFSSHFTPISIQCCICAYCHLLAYMKCLTEVTALNCSYRFSNLQSHIARPSTSLCFKAVWALEKGLAETIIILVQGGRKKNAGWVVCVSLNQSESSLAALSPGGSDGAFAK